MNFIRINHLHRARLRRLGHALPVFFRPLRVRSNPHYTEIPLNLKLAVGPPEGLEVPNRARLEYDVVSMLAERDSCTHNTDG